ncbi:MAG: hypothetical protein AAB225_09610, partial [Acidobacteriota bacterium]
MKTAFFNPPPMRGGIGVEQASYLSRARPPVPYGPGRIGSIGMIGSTGVIGSIGLIGMIGVIGTIG